MLPFSANKGSQSRTGFEPVANGPTSPNEVNADAFAIRIEEIQRTLRENMSVAQADHERYAKQHQGPTPQYRVGDLVWLSTKNLFIKRPCRGLENRHAGPYPVKKIVSTHAIELDLPDDFRVHLVFHVNLLVPVASEPPHPGHHQPPPSPVEVDVEDKYEVTAIVDSRHFGHARKLQYRLQWIGYLELKDEAPELSKPREPDTSLNRSDPPYVAHHLWPRGG